MGTVAVRVVVGPRGPVNRHPGGVRLGVEGACHEHPRYEAALSRSWSWLFSLQLSTSVGAKYAPTPVFTMRACDAIICKPAPLKQTNLGAGIWEGGGCTRGGVRLVRVHSLRGVAVTLEERAPRLVGLVPVARRLSVVHGIRVVAHHREAHGSAQPQRTPIVNNRPSHPPFPLKRDTAPQKSSLPSTRRSSELPSCRTND